jgi:hypothetical protein
VRLLQIALNDAATDLIDLGDWFPRLEMNHLSLFQ